MAVYFENCLYEEHHENIASEGSGRIEPLVILPSESEIRQDNQKRARQESIRKFSLGFIVGFFSFVIIFLIGTLVWKHHVPYPNRAEIGTPSCQRRIMAYYGGWQDIKIRESQIEKITHLVFDGIIMSEDGKVNFESEEVRFHFGEMKHKLRIMKSDVKILFSTGSFLHRTEHMSPAFGDSKTRSAWVQSISSFLIVHELDGVQVQYQWPETIEDKENYVYFVRELRYKFERIQKSARRKEQFIISIYAPENDWVGDGTSFLDDLSNFIDILTVETNSFYSPWLSLSTGPQSPLYSWNNNNKSVDFVMEDYTCGTSLPSRLIIVVPFVGYEWTNVKMTNIDDLYGGFINDTDEHTDWLWRDLKDKGWDLTSASWHNVSRTPFIWNPVNQSLLTFENERSLMEKMSYLVRKNLGGVLIDRLEYDDDHDTLLNAISSVDLCAGPKFKKDEIRYKCGGKGT